jgi:hypothetical protein
MAYASKPEPRVENSAKVLSCLQKFVLGIFVVMNSEHKINTPPLLELKCLSSKLSNLNLMHQCFITLGLALFYFTLAYNPVDVCHILKNFLMEFYQLKS